MLQKIKRPDNPTEWFLTISAISLGLITLAFIIGYIFHVLNL